MKKYKKDKTIWIDMDNSPHVPFFHPIIRALKKQNFKVILTIRDCFQTRGLANLYSLEYNEIGKHYGKNLLLKILGTMYRSLQLMPFALREKPVLAVSHGSRAQLLACFFLRIPDVIIYDYEFAKGLGFIKPTWKMAPEIIKKQANDPELLAYPGIKEDVYVPEHKPDPGVLEPLGLNVKDFIVTIRPPATEAHYHNPESEILFKGVVDYLSSQHSYAKMVILPRNEVIQRNLIEKTWRSLINEKRIIIPKTVVNGLDLMWYSDLVISGGGTMNREAAALGIPVYSIFRGTIGAVDRYLEQKGRLTLIEKVADIKEKIKLTPRDKNKSFSKERQNSLDAIISHLTALVQSKTVDNK